MLNKKMTTATILGIFAAATLATSGYADAGTKDDYVECALRFKWSDGWKPQRLVACYLGPHSLALYGEIDESARDEIVRILTTSKKIKTVFINSVGGDTFTAWTIGRTIRWRRINTHAHNICTSACMSIFIQGRLRSATNGIEFGLHRPSDYRGKGMSKVRAASWYSTTSAFWRYAKADMKLLERGFNTPNHQMLNFTNRKARKANVINHLRRGNTEERTETVPHRKTTRRKQKAPSRARTGLNGHIPLLSWFNTD